MGGQKDGVIDIGRTAGTESADLIGDGSLVFGEGHAELGVGGKGEKGDFVVGFERSESRVGGVSQRAAERTDRIAKIQNESDIERQFVAAKDVNVLGDAVFAKLEIFLF